MVRRVTELEGGFEGGFVRSLDTDWLQDSRAAAAAAGEGALGHSSRQLDTDGAPKRATSPATSTPPSLKKIPTQNSWLFWGLDFVGVQTLLK